MASNHRRLGDLLVENKLVSPEDLERAVTEQKRTGQLLGATLVRLGLLDEQVLVGWLHRQLGLPVLDFDTVAPDEQALGLIKEEQARKYLAIPVEFENKRTLVVAMADPLNVNGIEDLRFHTGMFIKPVLAAQSQILEAIERYYHIDTSVNEVIQSIISNEDDIVVSAVEDTEERQAIDELMKEAEGRPIVRLTNWLLHRAVEARASDIHIEPQNNDLIVRLRVDGLLREEQRLPKWTQGAIVSRIKVLANLDIAEKRQPQDGRLVAEIGGRRVDMRVSTLPITNGEKVVMRVVDQSRARVELDSIGFTERDLTRLKKFLSRPQGIILVTGPTGSGKSTLLYAALRHLQHVSRNITTVEDPVEYQIPGINQVHVDEKAKKTFAGALRAILRQDPDIIMIGEIRDKETAQIAFRASVTGHLVLSTVHTNDAAGAVTRLIDLGLEPFMVATSLVGVVSMRLVRTLCPKCKESYAGDPASIARLSASAAADDEPIELWRGAGCPACDGSGYAGRTGIFELLEVSDNVRRLINSSASDHEIRRVAIEEGMTPIGEDGLDKALTGHTTLDEITRVVYLAEQHVKVCPHCTHVVSQDFEYCTACGSFVGEHCEKCQKRLRPEWKHCPSCGAGHLAHRAPARKGDSKLMPVPPNVRKAS
ncbi:MAG: Flp pilus assembly complex ATPase component TadA [Candidatus Eisenbacteria bacterium]|uniref:Flp pilus assembly complex ATPase component TadA n=1 Tax=Eiseniibacteriota bacterium TaxID=2212470 RepID=A0A933W8X1_UNCEI|nr:Flp pilus assembly complex ATPase component TadA [Candidatus Eisenbacteria bacterium]